MGVFRLFVPCVYGGLNCDQPTSLRLFEELAAADASVGFNAVVWSHALAYVTALPPATLDAVYADGPDVIWTNSLIVGGEARPVAGGGYRISGRWPLVSGCEAADWVFVRCSQGPGRIIAAAAPARSWRIEDTWRAFGLVATGSQQIAADDLYVPASQVFELFGGDAREPSWGDGAALAALPLHFAAVAIGIARGALADVSALSVSAHRRMSSDFVIGKSDTHLATLGWASASVRAARALLMEEGAALASDTGGRHATSATAAWVIQTCARAVDACFNIAGAAAIYLDSPLQRRLRDMRALMQHRAANLDFVAQGAAELLGQPSGDAVGP
jgi:alkylation response protein AidB-like acyl-CoA dehydrogenase